MRVGIDAHSIGERKTGNETYSLNLVEQLDKLDLGNDEYRVYLTNAAAAERLSFGNLRLSKHLIPTASPALRMAGFFPLEWRREKIDVSHFVYFLPPALRGKTVLTVHDIIYERLPEFYTRAALLRNRMFIPNSCRRADAIIAVSQQTKRDIVEIYDIDPDKVEVVYEAAPESYQPVPKTEALDRVRKFGIEPSYLLYVGTLQPRKNLPRLLAAYSELRRHDRVGQKLVIVGKKEWMYDSVFNAIHEHKLEADIILTGYVPSDDLPSLYSAADALLYPSIYEGFGLPVVESMACGTPVLTSFGSSLEEVAGGAALLVDPCDVQMIRDGVEKIANDSEFRKRLSQLGLAQASRFSYCTMAEQTVAVYQKTCGRMARAASVSRA